MMRFESLKELRTALERRLSRQLDEPTWERLRDAYGELHDGLVYDGADLVDLLGDARRIGLRQRRRRRISGAAFLHSEGHRRSLEEDVESARTRSGLGMELGEGLPRLDGHLFLWLLSEVTTDCLSEDDERRRSAVHEWMFLCCQWRDSVAQTALLSVQHNISNAQAANLILGLPFFERQTSAEIESIPSVMLRVAVEGAVQGRRKAKAACEKRWKRELPRALTRIFLEANDWRLGLPPPLGSWEKARQMFNRIAHRRGHNVRFDTTDSFRMAARRAFADS